MVSFVSAQCADSDGGNIYSVHGTCNFEQGGQSDYCSYLPGREGILNEAYCGDNECLIEEHSCSEGEICRAGRCVEGNSLDPICVEDDRGKDEYNKGTTFSMSHVGATDSCYVSRSKDTPDGSLTDSCSKDMPGIGDSYCGVYEYYCTDNDYDSSVFIECPNGCMDGACIQVTEREGCYDSDDGIDYLTSGYCEDAYGVHEDECAGSTGQAARDWHCVQGVCEVSAISNCGAWYSGTVCSAGACLAEVVDSEEEIEIIDVSIKDNGVNRPAGSKNLYNGNIVLDLSGFGQSAGTHYSDVLYVYKSGDGVSIVDPYIKDPFLLCLNGNPITDYLDLIPQYSFNHEYRVKFKLDKAVPLNFAICDKYIVDNSGYYKIIVRSADEVIKPVEPTVVDICTDSDGGLNYYLKGKINIDELGGSDETNGTDSCLTYDDSDRGGILGSTGTHLLEWICCGNDCIDNVITECSNGCKDGACITGEDYNCVVDATQCNLGYDDILYGYIGYEQVWAGYNYENQKVCKVSHNDGTGSVWSFEQPGCSRVRELSTVVDPEIIDSTECPIGCVCDDQNIICEDLVDDLKCEMGCYLNGRCVLQGTRTVIDNIPVFCEFTNDWNDQEFIGASCDNNYECVSNFCSNGQCYDIAGEIEETQGVLDKIVEFLKNLFGFE